MFSALVIYMHYYVTDIDDLASCGTRSMHPVACFLVFSTLAVRIDHAAYTARVVFG